MDTLESTYHSGYDSWKGIRVLIRIQGPFFAFAAVVAGVAAWSIWGQDMFPSSDPTGGTLPFSHSSRLLWLLLLFAVYTRLVRSRV